MRLTWHDAVAAALTGAVVALYAAFTQGAYLPGMASPRAVAAAVLALGFLACATGAPAGSASSVVGNVLGVVTLLAGTVTLLTGYQPALAVTVATTVALWAFATARHAFAGRQRVEPPVAEMLLEQHKDGLPPHITVS